MAKTAFLCDAKAIMKIGQRRRSYCDASP